MKRKLKAGVTSYTIEVFVPDVSSTVGAGLTGLVFNTSGLTLYYHRQGANASVAVTLASGTLGTWSSGGFIAVDGTNMKGHYEIGVPDAALASGVKYVTLQLRGAANMPDIPVEIELDAVDYQDAVHFGLSSLPNTAVTGNASLLTSGTGTDQLSVTTGRVDLGKILGTTSTGAVGYVGVDWGQVTNKTTTNALTGTTIAVTQKVDVDTIKTNPVVNAGTVTFPTGATLASTTNITAGTITTVTTVTNQLTAAAIATGVWQDAAPGDFTTASSIGKSLYIANVAPGGSGGHLISGSNSGTTTLGALTVTGATTYTGNVSMAAGVTISQSTTDAAGMTVNGNGAGQGLYLAGGNNGTGLQLDGGGTSGSSLALLTTSGDAVVILPAAGHGINISANGTSKHGVTITGGTGGTSDGLKCVAGTGGVPIRGNITGNLVGTVSTLTTYTGNTPQTGDNYARLGAPAGASVSADVAAVKADTAAVKTKTDFLPSATAGAAGGVFIAGTNAATTVNITGTLSTVTTLTNLPAITAGWLTATGIAADAITAAKVADGTIDAATFATDAISAAAVSAAAVTKIQTGLTTGDTAGTTTLLTRLPSALTLTAGKVDVNDKTGFSLAAAGLDAISAAEPTAKPTTFAGWLMWLVQRFRRSTLTTTQLKTLTEAGATVTTQTVSDDNTTQSLGAPS